MAHHHDSRRPIGFGLLQILPIVLVVVVLFALHASSSSVVGATPPLLSCRPDQASALLQLKRSFTTTNYSAMAFRTWRTGTDCCRWAGIRCAHANANGNNNDGVEVTSLDLGERGLESGGLDSALFALTSLDYLNLAYNDFNGSQLPSRGFERLTKLTYLNLSSSSFSGPVPTTAIGSLTNLISLDLSTSYEIVDVFYDGFFPTFHESSDSIQLVEQNFEGLIHRLTNLRELHLGCVDLSSSGTRWCKALATNCPQLLVLSLPFCRLSGPVCGLLSTMHSISVINLEHNRLSGPSQDFFTNLSANLSNNLRVLQLGHNNLQGWIPPATFQHEKLLTIDLHSNLQISGHLPSFSINGSSLENLNVGMTNFSGTIQGSIGNLAHLKKLGLGAKHFSGELPSSIGNIKSLVALEIAGLEIVGSSMPPWIANLTSLMSLRIYHCGLSGPIPSFIGDLRNLKDFVLYDCGFSGEIPSHHISNLTQMEVLMLYLNNFTGILDLSFITNLPNLKALELSNNNLVVVDGEDNFTLASFPKILVLGLESCSLSKFPSFLRHQYELSTLDLSYNNIHGAIPSWVWETWSSLFALDLSNNELTSVGYTSYLLPLQVEILQLNDNMFEGYIPIPRDYAHILDYSDNMFSSVPPNFSSHLTDVTLFSATSNNLSGKIPSSFCGGTSIRILDLSYNNFSGSIPNCLMENVNGMESLSLNENKLTGALPDTIKEGCSFVSIDFSGNWIHGQLPRSLIACANLEILDVGNNQITDTFPCWMSRLPGLGVLVLKSNKLFGRLAQSIEDDKTYYCAFPSATIIDISSNNFTGTLPQGKWFQELKSMIFVQQNTSLVMEHKLPNAGSSTYQYSAAFTYKGHDTTFHEILRTLVFIDFSNNAFHGSIPAALGKLGLLHGLNISHNSLTGPIPSQLSLLRQLEALDLSFNELSGEIPQELAWMDFLTTLNLSDNNLVGSIPQSPHFLTFTNSSFLGNDGLCGAPLSKKCISKTTATVTKKKSVDIVLCLFAGLGFGIGLALAIVVAWGVPIRKR